MSSIPDDKRAIAREYLVKSKVYKLFASIFAVAGGMVFLILFFKQAEGDLFRALTSLSTVVIILIPFLPAIVLSRMGAKMEKNFQALVEPAAGAAAFTAEAAKKTEEPSKPAP